MFALLASASSLASLASFHMLVPSWSKALCWVVTIVFFTIASYGTKIIMDSINMKGYLGKMKRVMYSWLVILLVFWLCALISINPHTTFYWLVTIVFFIVVSFGGELIKGSIDKDSNLENSNARALFGGLLLFVFCFNVPTHTHALLYNSEINEVVKNDMVKTKGYLQDIVDNTSLNNRGAMNKLKGGDSRVLHSHIEAKNLLDELNRELERIQMRNMYTSYVGRSSKSAQLASAFESLSRRKEFEAYTKADSLLVRSYAMINNYSDFISISDKDKKVYQSGITRGERLLSVTKVWKDIFNGQFSRSSVIFFVLLSILVDILAFSYFYLATNSEEE